ncbi:MAG: folate-binding protein [Zoogloeaceae bacterium]|jgi:folate-binding protein YgfZ|nr:folate-binding protein [Zoogloeaceae bacterium]
MCASASDSGNFPVSLPNPGVSERELRAVTGNLPMVTPLSHLAVLEISGADAETFMQGQFTQDIRTLAPGVARFSAWCSVKGRMLANFVLYPVRENVYHLILAKDLAAFMPGRLRMFILRAKVQVSETSRALLGLSGAETPLPFPGMDVPTMALTTGAHDGIHAIRLPDTRLILTMPPQRLAETWNRLIDPDTTTPRVPTGQEIWQWQDIRAGLPWITAATSEAFVPQMADFEKPGVSFKKGCYVGQEVIARAQHLGKVKRRLYRLESGQPLAAGENLFSPACANQPDPVAGKVVTAAPSPGGGHAALAVLLETAATDTRQGGIDGPRLETQPVHPAET